MSEENKSTRVLPDEQLVLAVQRAAIDDCKKLITSGVDVNHRDRNGNTVIFLCNTPQHTKILRLLISAGANINVVNGVGNTPIHCAVERGCMEIILILILNGADLSAHNQNKQKPEDISSKLKPMLIALSIDKQAYSLLTETHKKKLTLIFEDIDRDASGILNLEKSMRFNRFMEDISAEVARRDAQDFLRDVAICHSGQVSLDEWLFSFAKLVAANGTEALDQFIDDYDRNSKDCKFEEFTPKD